MISVSHTSRDINSRPTPPGAGGSEVPPVQPRHISDANQHGQRHSPLCCLEPQTDPTEAPASRQNVVQTSVCFNRSEHLIMSYCWGGCVSSGRKEVFTTTHHLLLHTDAKRYQKVIIDYWDLWCASRLDFPLRRGIQPSQMNYVRT